MTEAAQSLRCKVLLTFQVAGDEEEGDGIDIEGEVAASFPDHEVSVRAKRLDAPFALNPQTLDAWVYSRKE